MKQSIIDKALLGFFLVTCLVPMTVFAKKKMVEPSFNQYQVKQQFHGKSALPQFNGRDREFRLYRTILMEEVKLGPNFAGHYRVIQIGCGAGCTDTYIANNKTGQIFLFPRSGEKNLYLQLTYQKSSQLIRAQWGNTERNTCLQEYFKWRGRSAQLLKTKKIGNLEYCFEEVHTVLVKPQKNMGPLRIHK